MDYDPEMKRIITWNHYLDRLRLFFRWCHNRHLRSNEESVGEPDWDTHEMVRIKGKKSKRVSQYSESVIIVLKNSLGICLNNIIQNTIACVSLYQTTNIADSSREEWIS